MRGTIGGDGGQGVPSPEMLMMEPGTRSCFGLRKVEVVSMREGRWMGVEVGPALLSP